VAVLQEQEGRLLGGNGHNTKATGGRLDSAERFEKQDNRRKSSRGFDEQFNEERMLAHRPVIELSSTSH
jgi:hypothetical protein